MGKKHMKCWLWKILWGLSALALVGTWITVVTATPILGADPILLLWTSLIFGVLAISIKLDCHSCDVCGVDAPRGM